MASAATMERARALIGAEVGHYWIFGDKILDLSAYGKFVDNFSQRFGSVLVSLGPQNITVQGIGESQYGADAGLRLAQPDQHRAALPQLRRQVPRQPAVAPGDPGV